MNVNIVQSKIGVERHNEVIKKNITTPDNIENKVEADTEKVDPCVGNAKTGRDKGGDDIGSSKVQDSTLNNTEYIAQHASKDNSNAIKKSEFSEEIQRHKQDMQCEQHIPHQLKQQRPCVKQQHDNTLQRSQPVKVNFDKSTNYSTLSLTSVVKPKIIYGPTEGATGVNPWYVKSPFDDLIFNLVPLTKGQVNVKHKQLLENIQKMRLIPVTPFKEGASHVLEQHASSCKASHAAFLKSRIATLRKSPTRIIVPKLSTISESETMSGVSDSFSDKTICTIRIDELQLGLPRFDPYHSDCGPDCRKCMFLAQTLPHLSPRAIKMTKNTELSKAHRFKSVSNASTKSLHA